jgi:hypothetical protein
MKTAYSVIRERSDFLSQFRTHSSITGSLEENKKKRLDFLKSLNLKNTFHSDESSLVSWTGPEGTKEK